MNHDEPLWVEKYRPQTVKECILPKRIKDTFENFVKNKSFPNLLLTGSAGTGKTTIALALCNELGYESIIINASSDRGIDMIRDTIHMYGSTLSIEGKPKAIILDEADGLGVEAQKALRGAIEKFPELRFILTCNFKNKILPPIHSRTTTVEFNLQESEKQDMMVQFLLRVFQILTTEKITFDKKPVGQIVKRFYPDNRRILNELQKYSSGGAINDGILTSYEGANVDTLIAAIKAKNVTQIRQWVANNADADQAMLFDQIYERLSEELKPECIPQTIITLADYQYKSAFAANQEINTAAMIWSLIAGGVEFK